MLIIRLTSSVGLLLSLYPIKIISRRASSLFANYDALTDLIYEAKLQLEVKIERIKRTRCSKSVDIPSPRFLRLAPRLYRIWTKKAKVKI